jgi:hypothetical protein
MGLYDSFQSVGSNGSYPPAYASANPAVASLFGNELAINRARMADELARQQLDAQRAQAAAEQIYKARALDQQSQQQQLQTFLAMLQNEQRNKLSQDEIAARERIAGVPYSPGANSQRMAELNAQIAGNLAVAKERGITPQFQVELQKEQERSDAEAADLKRQQASTEAILSGINDQIKKLDDERLKSHQEADKTSATGDVLRGAKLFSPALLASGIATVKSADSPQHALIDKTYADKVSALKATLDKQAPGLFIFRNNRFYVNPGAFATTPKRFGLPVPPVRQPAAIPGVGYDTELAAIQVPTAVVPSASDNEFVKIVKPDGTGGGTIPRYRLPYYKMIGYVER